MTKREPREFRQWDDKTDFRRSLAVSAQSLGRKQLKGGGLSQTESAVVKAALITTASLRLLP
jgi:hypothetical protein